MRTMVRFCGAGGLGACLARRFAGRTDGKGLHMRTVARWAGAYTAIVLGMALAGGPAAMAQTQPPFATQTQKPQQTQPQQRAPAVRKDEETKGESVAELKRRIEALEQKLLDMEVINASLETLARQGTNPRSSLSTSPSSPLSTDSAARIDGVEVQIRALAAQLDRLERQLQNPQTRSQLPPAPTERQATNLPPVQPQPKDSINEVLKSEPAPKAPAQQPRPQTVAVDSAAARDAYLKAYNLLIKQDYAAAENGFTSFLEQFGEHELAGNAQYWLAETYYVRGQFEQAAQGFLKGYQAYGRSQKAPDSLFKLALTLDKLGKREASCATFAQLGQKFPTAPQHLVNRAQAERARIGCL